MAKLLGEEASSQRAFRKEVLDGGLAGCTEDVVVVVVLVFGYKLKKTDGGEKERIGYKLAESVLALLLFA